LHAVGAVTTNDWSGFTLSITRPDFDYDGVPDGWELYTMSGTAGAGSSMTHTPWSSTDRDLDADGDGLAFVNEWNGGVAPTDPWSFDTDGDGIGDKAAREFYLARTDSDDGLTSYRGDHDNDQLSNFIEYLIQGMTNGMPKVSASRMSTFGGQLVPDYFLRYGSLYLGEMFTDHDMIEDWWEDENDGYSRYTYDADFDASGWSKWAKARMAISGVTNSPVVTVALSYSGVSSVAYSETVTVVAWREGASNLGKPDAKWSVPVEGLGNGRVTVKLGEPGEGRVREGSNMFAAWVGDGDFTPGAPYGVATGVDVGYSTVEPFAIELTDVDYSMVRINLKDAIDSQSKAVEQIDAELASNSDWWDRYADDYDDEVNRYNEILQECYDAVAASSDRRQFSVYDTADLHKAGSFGTNTTVAASNNIRVWLTQMLINGETKVGYYKKLPTDAAPVMFHVNLDDHPVLTEADMLSSLGTLDLGWDTLVAAYTTATPKPAANASNLTNAVFAIIFQTEPVGRFIDPNNGLVLEVKNHYEKGLVQTPVSNRVAKIENGRPVFSWTHANTINKAYPAFELRVWTKAGKLVYDSGALRAPARVNGVYSWTAPIWSGMMTPQGHVFEANTEYCWDVSMLDAKFTTPNPVAFSAAACATFDTANYDSMLSDSGSIAVAVKYMGPASNSVTTASGLIHVEAFKSPDFCGMPLASAYVRTNDTIAATNAVVMNAILNGLPRGSDYYLMAYIDTNGNGKRDEWESWGYGNYVGDSDRRDVYTPRAYAISEDLSVPTAVVYIEDVDSNGNKIPDAWEMEKDGVLGGTSTSGATTDAPFIVTIDTGLLSATNVFFVIDKDIINLPYYSVLNEMENGGSVSAASLALAMSGITHSNLTVHPEVKIVSFSPTAGLDLEIDPCVKVDGTTLASESVTTTVTLAVTVESATTLGADADWTSVPTVPPAVTVSKKTSVHINVGTPTPATAQFFRVRIGATQP